MICNMLGKNNKRNRRKQCEELDNGGNIDFARTFVERAEEGELGQGNEAAESYGFKIVCQGGIINDFKVINAAFVADNGEYGCSGIPCGNADDKGNQLHRFCALNGCKHRCKECDDADKNAHKVITVGRGGGVVDIVDCGTAKAETDKRNYRADDNGGKELVNPVCAGKMNDKSNDDVNNTCNECTDKNAEIAE